jgi:type IV pilus assembly protein PilQ
MNFRQLDSPGRLGLTLLAGVCLCLAACAAARPPAEAAAPADQFITDVTAGRQDSTTTVSIGVSSPPISFSAFKEAAPPKVVIEMPDIGPGEDLEPLAVNDGLVTTISRTAAEVKEGGGTRLEIGLAQAADYEVQRQESRLIVTLVAQGSAGPAPEAPPEEGLVLEGTARTPAEAEAAAPEEGEAAAAAEAGPKPEGGPKPAEGISVEAAASAPGSPCRVQAVEFKRLPDGKCQVTVATSAKAGYELARVSRDTLLLTLRQAKLPPELARPLDTSQFAQAAINAVSPQQSDADVLISLRFREVVPYHLAQEENNLVLEFEASRAKPSPQITLAGREPETPTPAAAALEQAVERAPEDLEAAAPPPKTHLVRAAEEAELLPGAIRVIYPGMQRHFTGRRISLDFQNADVHNVLRLIAEVSGLNIITGDDVKGRITMRLVKIPWDQALDIVLASCNLAMSRTGNVIRVASANRFREEQKQADEAAQGALDAMRKKENLVPLVTEKVRINYAKAEQMKDRIGDILSPRGKVTFDERTNVIIIRDIPECVTTARNLIESLDWPTPQVMIEARIVEATSTFSRDLGTQWGAQFQKTYGAIDGTIGAQGATGFAGAPSGVPFIVNLPTSSMNAFGGLGFTFSKLSGSLNIDARLLASETQGKLRIISAPKIATLDNTEAYIQQGEDIPYLAQSVDGISTQFVQTALKLTVTPHITPDGRVRMKIHAEKSEPSDREIMGTPGILRKETVTEVLVNHGETVVIGGILKDTNRYQENRIPFFHRIPILGWLFKEQIKDEEKQELLIFITPKIMAMEKRHQMI